MRASLQPFPALSSEIHVLHVLRAAEGTRPVSGCGPAWRRDWSVRTTQGARPEAEGSCAVGKRGAEQVPARLECHSVALLLQNELMIFWAGVGALRRKPRYGGLLAGCLLCPERQDACSRGVVRCGAFLSHAEFNPSRNASCLRAIFILPLYRASSVPAPFPPGPL